MSSCDVIAGPASRQASPPVLLRHHPLLSKPSPLSSSSAFFHSVVIFFLLLLLLLELLLPRMNQRPVVSQTGRQRRSQPLLLPKSHSSTFSGTISSISGGGAFIKVCFLGLPRQRFSANGPRGQMPPAFPGFPPQPCWEPVNEAQTSAGTSFASADSRSRMRAAEQTG